MLQHILSSDLYLAVWAMDWFHHGTISALGSIAYYLHQIKKKNEVWEIKSAFIHFSLGFFIGNLVSSFLPRGFDYMTGTLLISGYCVYTVLGLLESQSAKIIVNLFSKGLGTALLPVETKNVDNNTNNNDKPDEKGESAKIKSDD